MSYRERNVSSWIMKLNNDGSKLHATHGERGVSGNDANHYGSPQDVAFMPDGRVLVADGLETF